MDSSLPTYPERIVGLTEETTETLYLLGEGHRVVGVSGYTVRPAEARAKPKVSSFIQMKSTIISRPGWGDVPAVETDRICDIPSTHILQPGPAALTEGVRLVHERLALSASGAHSTVTFEGISRFS
jgi:ABC-type hemin transport system substrate-binding protein